MVINQNNSHINSFTKGMNSDSAYDQIDNSQYVYGQNVRITKNQLLGGAGDYSTVHEGIITPVPSGMDIDMSKFTSEHSAYNKNGEQEILAVDSVDNLGTIITTNGTALIVYRIVIKDDVVESFIQAYKFSEFWTEREEHYPLSTVLYKELENVIKLYIASDKYPIVVLRVDDQGLEKTTQDSQNLDAFINNRIVPNHRVYINDVISGRIPASQVQYTYRFYNKYGNTTQLAQLTNKIQVIDSSRDKETGSAEGTETSKGFQLHITIDQQAKLFDRMQVFRLTFIKPGENAEVSLIYDDKIKEEDGTFVLNDVGIEPLQTLTIEEFAAMSGLILTPHAIENNQNYMFCANVKDETIIRDVNIDTDDQTIGFVTTDVLLSNVCDGHIPEIPTDHFDNTNVIRDYETNDQVLSVSNYFESMGINNTLPYNTYNDIFTSSLLRSLRRGEEYKYAIVYYDKYGRRSDVLSLGSKQVDEIDINTPNSVPFKIENDKLFAQPIGVKINVPTPKDSDGNPIPDIIGCQIVRRSSSEVYQKTLLQVALARPVQQGLVVVNGDYSSEKKSPFYPTGFLSTIETTITPPYYTNMTVLDSSRPYQLTIRDTDTISEENYKNFQATTRNKNLFQIFSSEIDYRRDDVIEKLNVSNTTINELLYVGSTYNMYGSLTERNQGYNNKVGLANWAKDLRFFGILDEDSLNTLGEHEWTSTAHGTDGVTIHKDSSYMLDGSDKENIYWVFDYFNINPPTSEPRTIKSIKDVKIPGWNDGFSDIQRDSENEIFSGIKKYRSYTTTIDQYTYNNWVSACKYDFAVGREGLVEQSSNDYFAACEFLSLPEELKTWLEKASVISYKDADLSRQGYIGAGSSCFLMVTDDDFGTYTFPENAQKGFYTSICNIQHSPKTELVQSEEQTVYYGFGNYFSLENGETQAVLFDGDVYITPHEFTTLYKTYNFESPDTLQSTQITNYIPLESKVNTYFDYGKNLLNTNNSTLIYEPGDIDGIITQERPVHQYNMIYSDNDVSNDVFTLISTDKNETNEFRQRAYFSEPKTNGEFIDNFLIFKTASFIDVDSKYGQITNLLTDKNTLFYWQEHGFGRFSVNERSLINDQNGNTIMLGQAGILSRFDYISTYFGMRKYDFCAVSTEQGLYWADINNKAVVAADSSKALNYSEQLNVQNIINGSISEDYPKVHYDLQNNELVCKMLNDEQQLVFNTKFGIATSIYDRDYDDILDIKNHMYGIKQNPLSLKKFNYLAYTQDAEYLSPMYISFIINPSASVTKVFDSQQIIPIKRASYLPEAFDNIKTTFETDLYTATRLNNKDIYTDREGNIIYNIPRFGNEQYGNRLRGKWMKVDMTGAPSEYSTISHVITKFRQSFS